jgi:hypothetical protein
MIISCVMLDVSTASPANSLCVLLGELEPSHSDLCILRFVIRPISLLRIVDYQGCKAFYKRRTKTSHQVIPRVLSPDKSSVGLDSSCSQGN